MLTHIYPHKPLRKIKVTICNYQADSPLFVWPDVWSGDLQVLEKVWSYMTPIMAMSLPKLGAIKPHQPNLYFRLLASYWSLSEVSCLTLPYVRRQLFHTALWLGPFALYWQEYEVFASYYPISEGSNFILPDIWGHFVFYCLESEVFGFLMPYIWGHLLLIASYMRSLLLTALYLMLFLLRSLLLLPYIRGHLLSYIWDHLLHPALDMRSVASQ